MANPATIQRISDLEPIPNADKIEAATIGGWTVVVQKDIHQIDDLVVYIEIDSTVPRRSWSEFLFDKPDQDRARIRTKKLRGVISQGLIIPIEALNLGKISYDKDEVDIISDDEEIIYTFSEDMDVSELLDVKHYEKPEFHLNKRGQLVRVETFPSFIPKTDETLMQSCMKCLEELKGHKAYATIKYDGSSFTAFIKDGDIGICSRRYRIEPREDNPEGHNRFLFAADKYKIRQILKEYHKSEKATWWDKIKEFFGAEKKETMFSEMGYSPNIAIQGEVCGPGIQKNRLGLEEVELFIFDIWDIDKQQYWDCLAVEDFCEKYNLKEVKQAKLFDRFEETKESLLELAEQQKYPNGHPAEGIVVRPIYPLYSDKLRGRLSFKVMNNKYLLKEAKEEDNESETT